MFHLRERFFGQTPLVLHGQAGLLADVAALAIACLLCGRARNDEGHKNQENEGSFHHMLLQNNALATEQRTYFIDTTLFFTIKVYGERPEVSMEFFVIAVELVREGGIMGL
ncbi:MAG: hypothetical protein ACYC7J_05050 [Syntrophales bacterium]